MEKIVEAEYVNMPALPRFELTHHAIHID